MYKYCTCYVVLLSRRTLAETLQEKQVKCAICRETHTHTQLKKDKMVVSEYGKICYASLVPRPNFSCTLQPHRKQGLDTFTRTNGTTAVGTYYLHYQLLVCMT